MRQPWLAVTASFIADVLFQHHQGNSRRNSGSPAQSRPECTTSHSSLPIGIGGLEGVPIGRSRGTGRLII